MRIAALVAVLWLVLMPSVAAASAAEGARFIGPIADHLLDRTGQLGIADVTAPGAAFTAASGTRAPNHGPSPSSSAALWLRVAVPVVADGSGDDRVFALREPRVRAMTLFVPAGAGWRILEWRTGQTATGAAWPTRYPALSLPTGEVAGRTVYLRIQTPSSMRGSLWLHSDTNFLSAYAAENLLFGIAFGVLAGLAIYLAAAGIVARDALSGALATLILAYLGYVIGDQGFVETFIWPGAVMVGRFLSFGGTFLIFAAMLVYAPLFLRVKQHYPRVAVVVRWAAAAALMLTLAAIVSVAIDSTLLRRFVAPIGITAIAGCLTLVALTYRVDSPRALVFLLCWGPMLTGGLLRMLHDVTPVMGANPLAVNLTYLAACLSLLLSGVASAIDLQRRERAARKAAEEAAVRLRAFAESASDSFWECDGRGHVTFASGPTCLAIGLEPGVTVGEILARDISAGGLDANARFSAALAVGSGFDASIALRDASSRLDQRLVRFRARPVEAEPGLRGIVSDVTRQVAAEERQAQQRKMAAIGQLAGGVAHEINNLLHPIVNLSRRVAGQFAPADERRKFLDIVTDSGRRASAIVSGLLTSVRPPPDPQRRAPLGPSLADAIQHLRTMLPDKVTLTFESGAEPGPVVDANEAFQVLANLVANAMYATRGGGRIAVLFRGSRASGFALSVEDDGEGMDEDTRQRALEPFFTTKQPGQGTGLGLPIVYGIARSWNAAIDIQSQPGVGTRVTIAIPGATPPAKDRAHASQA
ncbi:MAG: sensor histidine kinase [Proteobacteria bacterium]|nr:sensor histidine kinase [Pseudomonadota bacterium]